MNDAALRQALDKEVIFARMAPDHKLRLVSAFQARAMWWPLPAMGSMMPRPAQSDVASRWA